MTNKLKITALILIITLPLVSCYQVFRSSVFAGIPIDMSTMTDEQKVSYAEDLLSTGTDEELEAAYAAIEALLPEDPSEAPELALLAADLAIGASGISETITSALEAVTSGADVATTLLADLTSDEDDLEDLGNAVAMMEAAEAGGADISSEQYANAAAAQMLLIIEDVGGVDNLGSVPADDPELLQAQSWASEAGIDIESLLAGTSSS